MQNFLQQFQMPLSQKQKTLSEPHSIFYCISEICMEHFQKEDEYPSLIISESIDAERRGYLNV